MVEESIIICHGDTDGTASAAIALRKYPEARIVFAQPSDLSVKLSRLIKPSLVIITDVAIDIKLKQSVIKHFKRLRSEGCRVIYIDHHKSSFDKEVIENVDEFHYGKENRSASFLTSKALKVDAPDLVDLGMLGDKVMEVKSHPLYEISKIVGRALALKPRDYKFRKYLIKELSTDVRNIAKDEEVTTRADVARKLMRLIRKEAKSRIVYEEGDTIIVNFSDRPIGGLGSLVATDLAEEERKHVFFVHKPVKAEQASIIARGFQGSRKDLGSFISDFATQLGGSGGGHSLAASARIPFLSCEEVVEELIKRIKAEGQ